MLEFKKHDEALEWFAKARKLDPKRVQPYNLAGKALSQQNELKAAAEMFRKGLAIAPESADTRFNYGRTLHRLGDKDSGIKQMIRAISLDNENYEFLISIGEILLQEKQYAEYEMNLRQIQNLSAERPVPKSLQPRLEKFIKANWNGR